MSITDDVHRFNPCLWKFASCKEQRLNECQADGSGKRLILRLLSSTVSTQTNDSWRPRLICAQPESGGRAPKHLLRHHARMEDRPYGEEYPVVFQIRNDFQRSVRLPRGVVV